MSHLSHIVKLKQDLIGNDVKNPEAQIAIVRTAYVKALISINSAFKMDEEECINFNRFILSYWNETTPVNGHLVMSAVGNFFRALEATLNGSLVDNKLKIEITGKVDDVEFDFVKLESYADLISALKGEAVHKLEQFRAVKVSA